VNARDPARPLVGEAGLNVWQDVLYPGLKIVFLVVVVAAGAVLGDGLLQRPARPGEVNDLRPWDDRLLNKGRAAGFELALSTDVDNGQVCGFVHRVARHADHRDHVAGNRQVPRRDAVINDRKSAWHPQLVSVYNEDVFEARGANPGQRIVPQARFGVDAGVSRKLVIDDL
jgi:hypothetical protein